ncbi:hypothetical protein PVT67_13910 [Gallaecimonas kandeliae]|uniref:hypothetical protein n=1 Tax=Gallaecimonas kandeliae TaxID=3029055 RepID=UPI0026485855|nr:hypothetical protein [Gallaecimonas kandeliae]WKE64751.1 hypothetical protein PVT67_13910 [Gallaecimonas kandeliae]
MTLLSRRHSPTQRQATKEALTQVEAELAQQQPHQASWQGALAHLVQQQQGLALEAGQQEAHLKALLADDAPGTLAQAELLAALENQLQDNHRQQQVLKDKLEACLQLERRQVDLRRQLSLLDATEGLEKMVATLEPAWPGRKDSVQATLQAIRAREASRPLAQPQPPASAASVLARLKGERP